MRIALPASLVALLVVPSLASAAGVEISGFGGYTFPFYSQSFSYDPGPITIPIPNVSVQQNGVFKIDASGGGGFGGAVAFFPVSAVGIEFRLDSAALTLDTSGASYDVNVALPPPLDPIKSTLALTKGTATLNTAHPWSLNLKLRTPGQSNVYVSGGLSHLGDLQLSVQQQVALGVTAVNLVTGNLEIGTLDLHAQPTLEKSGSSWGGNLGLGFQIGLGEHGGLFVEGRGFLFAKQTAEWTGVVDTPLTDLQKQLLQRVIDKLQPVDFKPWWVQGTIGISYRF